MEARDHPYLHIEVEIDTRLFDLLDQLGYHPTNPRVAALVRAAYGLGYTDATNDALDGKPGDLGARLGVEIPR